MAAAGAGRGRRVRGALAARRGLRARDGGGRAPARRRRRPRCARVGRCGDRPADGARRGRARGRRDAADGGVRARGGPCSPAGASTRRARSTPPPRISATSPARSSSARCCAPGSGRRDRDHRHRQRQGRRRGGRAATAPDRLPPASPRAHRHARRLRARRLRRVHRPPRRRLGPRLLPARGPGRRLDGGDGRVARRGRDALAAARGVQAPPRAPVRLLHARAS